MTIITGIDPGGTTGVIVVDENADGFQVELMYQVPWENRISFFMTLFDGKFIASSGKPLLSEIVVIESFRLRPGRAMEQVGSDFPSVRVIGIVETLIALCLPKPLLVFQEPAIIGRTEILSEHKDMLSGMVHAQDAYRHVRYYHLTTGRNRPMGVDLDV